MKFVYVLYCTLTSYHPKVDVEKYEITTYRTLKQCQEHRIQMDPKHDIWVDNNNQTWHVAFHCEEER